MVQRQNRMDGAPGELAVADLAAARSGHAAGLADRERREVVVQEERLLVGPVQGVDPLLVLAGAERGHHQRLRLAAGEQRRAVSARQHADLGHDRPHRLHVAAVDALAGVEDVPAHDLGFELLEDVGDLQLRIRRVLHALRTEMRNRLGLGGIDRLVALHLVGDRIGGAQVTLDQAEHFLFQRLVVGQREVARLLGGLLGELDDGVDHRLEMPVAEHHGAEHHVFGQLLRFQLDHQHGVLRAGDDEVELALRHLVEHRVEHVFVVDEADARRADRPHERSARKRQRRRGRDQRQDVGIVLEIMRQRRHDDLGFVAPTRGEQRPHRAIDQPRDQRLFLGRAAFALEIAAGNAACCVEFFLVVDGEREKVDAFSRLLGGDHGRQHLRTRHRWRRRRRRPGGLSCRSLGRACALPSRAQHDGYRTLRLSLTVFAKGRKP